MRRLPSTALLLPLALVCVCAHSPYSSGRRHGSQVALREMLEPIFVKHNVSLVFSAGDNIYERVTPQKEILYFVVGAGGSVRRGDIDRSSGFTAAAFDTDLTFLAAEVGADSLVFNVISRNGETVDSGRVPLRK